MPSSPVPPTDPLDVPELRAVIEAVERDSDGSPRRRRSALRKLRGELERRRPLVPAMESLATRPGYNANPNDWVRYAKHLERELADCYLRAASMLSEGDA